MDKSKYYNLDKALILYTKKKKKTVTKIELLEELVLQEITIYSRITNKAVFSCTYKADGNDAFYIKCLNGYANLSSDDAIDYLNNLINDEAEDGLTNIDIDGDWDSKTSTSINDKHYFVVDTNKFSEEKGSLDKMKCGTIEVLHPDDEIGYVPPRLDFYPSIRSLRVKKEAFDRWTENKKPPKKKKKGEPRQILHYELIHRADVGLTINGEKPTPRAVWEALEQYDTGENPIIMDILDDIIQVKYKSKRGILELKWSTFGVTLSKVRRKYAKINKK